MPSIAVIIPSQDMSSTIEQCVGAAMACNYPRDRLEVFVVADHCSDDTGERARALGATILNRNDGPPGKTYALEWTFEILKKRGLIFDLYVVTDATARLDRDFFVAMVAQWRRGENIIVGHSLVALENQKWFAQCLGLTLVHRNLQNAAREGLGLSSLIEGRGMAYSDTYVQRHGWSLARPSSSSIVSHPTEDWRHGVRAVENGYRVAFADRAKVRTPLRDTLSAATKQGIRWERGRVANAGTHALRLLVRAVTKKNRLMLFAALDAIQPPVAVLAAICGAVALIGSMVSGNSYLVAISILPLGVVGMYGSYVTAMGRLDGIRSRTVLWAPIYVLWRCSSFVLAWTRFDQTKSTSSHDVTERM